jgi:hypothetical protein
VNAVMPQGVYTAADRLALELLTVLVEKMRKTVITVKFTHHRLLQPSGQRQSKGNAARPA